MRHIASIAAFFLALSCLGMPQNVQPINGFALERYLGSWYEIARLDHRFERGLSEVTAQYDFDPDGSVRVKNRGFNANSAQWEEIIGRGKFAQSPDQGHLKVSFFGPFYGSYVIFDLGENYDYAFVSGPNENYLWFLSRSADPDEALRARFVNEAKKRGFDLEALIWVEHGVHFSP